MSQVDWIFSQELMWIGGILLVARHRVRDRVDAIASLEAGSEWGEPVAWAATAGLKVRW